MAVSGAMSHDIRKTGKRQQFGRRAGQGEAAGRARGAAAQRGDAGLRRGRAGSGRRRFALALRQPHARCGAAATMQKSLVASDSGRF